MTKTSVAQTDSNEVAYLALPEVVAKNLAQTKTKTRSNVHAQAKSRPSAMVEAQNKASLSLADGISAKDGATAQDGATATDGLTAMTVALDGSRAAALSAVLPGADSIYPPVLAATNSAVQPPQVPPTM